MKAGLIKKIDRLLSPANLRRTKPRIAVLGALLAAAMPLTRRQIAKRISTGSPDKVTIYRTLESFIGAGLVHKAFLQNRTWHFELAYNCTKSQCHPHFTCKICGATKCLVGLYIPVVKDLKNGFVIHRQQVQLEGLCPHCA